MIALEIHLNGRRLCLAGADDLTVLHASIGALGLLGSKGRHGRPLDETHQEAASRDLHFDLQVSGLTSRGPDMEDSHLKWCSGVNIGVGDTVTVRIVNIDPAEADQPAKDQPTAASTSERYEKHLFERAKKTYLALREKYGDGAA